jgi:hypothetical protein
MTPVLIGDPGLPSRGVCLVGSHRRFFVLSLMTGSISAVTPQCHRMLPEGAGRRQDGEPEHHDLVQRQGHRQAESRRQDGGQPRQVRRRPTRWRIG